MRLPAHWLGFLERPCGGSHTVPFVTFVSCFSRDRGSSRVGLRAGMLGAGFFRLLQDDTLRRRAEMQRRIWIPLALAPSSEPGQREDWTPCPVGQFREIEVTR